MKWKNIKKEIFQFILVSGLGWTIDFSIFLVLTSCFRIWVGIANFISAIPAITFVFFISTHKIFEKNGKLPIYQRYIIYFIYQTILIFSVSVLGQYTYDLLLKIVLVECIFLYDYLKIIVKLMITPVTMMMNFFVMKILTEKL